VKVLSAFPNADLFMVDLMEKEGAEAVISNDADFCVIRGSRLVILEELMEAVQQEAASVPVYPPKFVATSLGLDVSQLPLLSCLCGNDFTAHVRGLFFGS